MSIQAKKINLVNFMRWLDDQPLDPYQHRFIYHIWRVGICFKGIRTLAQDTMIGKTKVSELKKWALEEGWITETTHKNGRLSIEINPEILANFEIETTPHAVRVADNGVRVADNGVRVADNGVRVADNGVRVAGHKYTSLSIPDEVEEKEAPHTHKTEETIDDEPHVLILNQWIRETFVDRPEKVRDAQRWHDAFKRLYDMFGDRSIDELWRVHYLEANKEYRTLNPIKLIRKIIRTGGGGGNSWETAWSKLVEVGAEAATVPRELVEVVRPMWPDMRGKRNGDLNRFRDRFREEYQKVYG